MNDKDFENITNFLERKCKEFKIKDYTSIMLSKNSNDLDKNYTSDNQKYNIDYIIKENSKSNSNNESLNLIQNSYIYKSMEKIASISNIIYKKNKKILLVYVERWIENAFKIKDIYSKEYNNTIINCNINLNLKQKMNKDSKNLSKSLDLNNFGKATFWILHFANNKLKYIFTYFTQKCRNYIIQNKFKKYNLSLFYLFTQLALSKIIQKKSKNCLKLKKELCNNLDLFNSNYVNNKNKSNLEDELKHILSLKELLENKISNLEKNINEKANIISDKNDEIENYKENINILEKKMLKLEKNNQKLNIIPEIICSNCENTLEDSSNDKKDFNLYYESYSNKNYKNFQCKEKDLKELNNLMLELKHKNGILIKENHKIYFENNQNNKSNIKNIKNNNFNSEINKNLNIVSNEIYFTIINKDIINNNTKIKKFKLNKTKITNNYTKCNFLCKEIKSVYANLNKTDIIEKKLLKNNAKQLFNENKYGKLNKTIEEKLININSNDITNKNIECKINTNNINNNNILLLNQELIELNKELSKFKLELKHSNIINKKIEKELNELKSKNTVRNENLEKIKKENEDLKKLLNSLNYTPIIDAKNKLKKLSEEKIGVLNTLDKINKEYNDFKNKHYYIIESYENKLKSFEKVHEDKNNKEDLLLTIEKLKNEIKKLKFSTVDNLIIEKQKMEVIIRNKDKDIKNIKTSYNLLECNLQTTKKELNQSYTDLKNYHRIVQKLEFELNLLNQKNINNNLYFNKINNYSDKNKSKKDKDISLYSNASSIFNKYEEDNIYPNNNNPIPYNNYFISKSNIELSTKSNKNILLSNTNNLENL